MSISQARRLTFEGYYGRRLVKPRPLRDASLKVYTYHSAMLDNSSVSCILVILILLVHLNIPTSHNSCWQLSPRSQ